MSGFKPEDDRSRVFKKVNKLEKGGYLYFKKEEDGNICVMKPGNKDDRNIIKIGESDIRMVNNSNDNCAKTERYRIIEYCVRMSIGEKMILIKNEYGSVELLDNDDPMTGEYMSAIRENICIINEMRAEYLREKCIKDVDVTRREDVIPTCYIPIESFIIFLTSRGMYNKFYIFSKSIKPCEKWSEYSAITVFKRNLKRSYVRLDQIKATYIVTPENYSIFTNMYDDNTGYELKCVGLGKREKLTTLLNGIDVVGKRVHACSIRGFINRLGNCFENIPYIVMNNDTRLSMDITKCHDLYGVMVYYDSRSRETAAVVDFSSHYRMFADDDEMEFATIRQDMKQDVSDIIGG